MTDIVQQSNTDDYYFLIEANKLHAEVTISSDLWVAIPDIVTHVFKVLNAVEGDDGLEHVSILLTNDAHIQQLNSDFRNMDKPTNVLSFPSDEEEYIGDIAIAYETLEREAKEQDKDFIHHFIHMLIHGILHLYGYDHINNKDAEDMESLEIKILADMGIENPYI